MKTYSILTSFNDQYYKEVAKDTITNLDKNWIDSGKIYLYHELDHIPISLSNRVKWLDLYRECTGITEFINQWKDHPNANGSTGFRSNAVKFVHKTFPIWHCAKNSTDDWLVWLDADAFVHKKIDQQFIGSIFNEDISIAYLGRPSKYSECGFLAFNLQKQETLDFLNSWENLYKSGKFISLPETHDSWTFDYIRKSFGREELFLNLNKNAKTNKNPFGQSLIGGYFMHAKGADKEYQLKRFKNKQVGEK